MHRQPSFDLRYTHEIPAVAPYEPIQTVSHPRRASDLTARLRCLKTLYDLEREGSLDACGPASELRPVHVRKVQ